MYKELIEKSWRDTKQNMVLVVPNLLFLISVLVSGFLLLVLSGLLEAFLNLKSLEGNEAQVVAQVQKIALENIGAILGYGLLWVLIICIGFFLARAVTLGMMADLLKKKKPALANAGKYIQLSFWRLVSLNIFVTCIFLLVLLASMVVGMIVFFFLPWIIPLVILSAGITMLWFYSIFFLSKQVLVCEQKTALVAMKESKKIFSEHKKGMIKAMVLLWGISLIATIGISILGLIPLVGVILEQICFLVLGVWTELFTFHVYSKRKELR